MHIGYTVLFFLWLQQIYLALQLTIIFSLLLYCWKLLVIYLGQSSASLFPKWKEYVKFLTTTPKLNQSWHIILVSYYLQKCSSQFLQTYVNFPLFYPVLQMRRGRNHRINWANGANLPKRLWWNKWEKQELSVLIYSLFQVPFSL